MEKRYPRVIDAHVHWYPREFVDLMIKKGPANGAVMGDACVEAHRRYPERFHLAAMNVRRIARRSHGRIIKTAQTTTE